MQRIGKVCQRRRQHDACITDWQGTCLSYAEWGVCGRKSWYSQLL